MNHGIPPWDSPRFMEYAKARAAILATGTKPRKAGRIDCPVCGKHEGLTFAVHADGHISAACAKEGCVRWAE